MSNLDTKKPVWVVSGNTHGLWGKPEKYTYREGYFGIEMWLPVKKSIDDSLDDNQKIGLSNENDFFRFVSYEESEAKTFYLGAKTALSMLTGLVNSAK